MPELSRIALGSDEERCPTNRCNSQFAWYRPSWVKSLLIATSFVAAASLVYLYSRDPPDPAIDVSPDVTPTMPSTSTKSVKTIGNEQLHYFTEVGHGELALMANSSSDYATSDEVRQFCVRAQAFQKKGELEKAIANYTEAIRQDPNWAVLYINRGGIYADKGDLGRAMDDYHMAIKIDSRSYLALTNRGIQYRKMGDYDRALSDLDQAVELAKDSEDASITLSARADLYREMGKYDKVTADLTAALHRDADSTPRMYAFYKRAGAYMGLGKYDKALHDYTSHLNVFPEDADAYYYRSLAHEMLGDQASALRDFRVAVDRDPKLKDRQKPLLPPPVYDSTEPDKEVVRIGAAKRDIDSDGDPTDDSKTTTTQYERDNDPLSSRNAQDDAANVERASDAFEKGLDCLKQTNSVSPAIAHFTLAINNDPNLASAYNNRGAGRLEIGDLKGAVEDFNRALEIDPNLSAAQLNRARTYQARNDYDQALSAFNEVIAMHKNSWNGFIARGDFFDAHGQYKEAIVDYSSAIRIDSKYPFPFVYISRADAYTKTGQFAHAVSDYSSYLEENPAPIILYRRGLANKHLGLLPAAEKDRATAVHRDAELQNAVKDPSLTVRFLSVFVNEERAIAAARFTMRIDMGTGQATDDGPIMVSFGNRQTNPVQDN